MKLKSGILYSLTSLLIAYNAHAMEHHEEGAAGAGAGVVGVAAKKVPNLKDDMMAAAGRLINSPTEVDGFIDIIDRYGVVLQDGQSGTNRYLITVFGMNATDFLTTIDVSARNFAEKTSLLPFHQQISLLIDLQKATVTSKLATARDFLPTASDILNLADQIRVSLVVNTHGAMEVLTRTGLFASFESLRVVTENAATILQYATVEQRAKLSQELGTILNIPETPEINEVREKMTGIWGQQRGYDILIEGLNKMLLSRSIPPHVIELLAGARLTFSHIWSIFGRMDLTELSTVLTQLEIGLRGPAPAPVAPVVPAVPAEDSAARERLRAEQEAAFVAAQAADAAREEGPGMAGAGAAGAGVGAAAAAHHSILTDDDRKLITTLHDAIAVLYKTVEARDGMDVHEANRSVLAPHSAALLDLMERAVASKGPGTQGLQSIDAYAAEVNHKDLTAIKRVIQNAPHAGISPELGGSGSKVLTQAWVLAAWCDEVEGASRFRNALLESIAQNITTGGGCTDGVVGRALILSAECFQFLREREVL